MEITGKIIAALPEQGGTSRSGNPWKKREYVLETLENYPRKVCFNLFGDRADQFPLTVGEVVTVSFDLESREYNGRWYTDVRAWKVDKGAPAAAPMGGQYQQPAYQQPAPGFGGAAVPPAAPVPPQMPQGYGDPFGAQPAAPTANEGDDLPF